jgi:hypothetical protein
MSEPIWCDVRQHYCRCHDYGKRCDDFDDLLRAMRRAREALYNGFEPDNQSRAYHDADEAIKKAMNSLRNDDPR